MADGRLNLLLKPLEAPVTPDPEFSDSLYRKIAPSALAAGRRDRTWYGRIAATIRSAPVPLIPAADARLRTVVLAATLLALLLALAGVIGSRPPDPNRLVISSEAVYRDPPSLDMTVAYADGGVRRFRYDGEAIARLDVLTGSYRTRSEGSYILTDANLGRRVEWDPDGGTWSVVFAPCCQRPLYELDLRWGATASGPIRAANACLDWEYVEGVTVIGRPAHHVRCLSGRHEEYWVDAETGFVLRSTDVPSDDPDGRTTGEILSLSLGAPVDANAFQWPTDDPRVGAQMRGGDAALEPRVRAVSNTFSPAFAVTPGEGWRSWGTDDDVVGFVRGPDWSGGTDGAGVWIIRPATVTDVRSGRDLTLPPGSEAVLEWLRAHPYLDVGEVEPARIADRTAKAMPFRQVLPDDFEAACAPASDGEEPPACRRWFRASAGYWTFGRPTHDAARATILEVNGTTIMILSWADGRAKDAHLTAIDELLASLEFLD